MHLPEFVASLPFWTGAITAEPVKGGLSNEIWLVTDDAGQHIARIGSDYPWHHVDRAREAMVTRAAHVAGYAPAVKFTAPGVMVTDYLQVRTWTESDLRRDPARVAQLLRDFHSEMPDHVSGAAFLFWPFHVVRDYVRTLAGTRHAHVGTEALRINARMERVQVPLPIIFGHNDLLAANFLEDDSRLWLVDYEYAGFSTALFDLAGAASNSDMSHEAAAELLSVYFGRKPDRDLSRAYDAMKVTALLREWLWALVSDLHLSAPGVDYMDYAATARARLDAAQEDYRSRWSL